MEPVQAKPLRRRRRWLIVAFVVLLVWLCTWWYWPRGAARFVGRWALYTHSRPESSSGTLVLRGNGIAEWTGRAGCIVGTWRAENQDLVVGTCDLTKDSALRRQINDALFRVRRTRIANVDSRWHVARIDGQSFEATEVDDLTGRKFGPTMFRRIPE